MGSKLRFLAVRIVGVWLLCSLAFAAEDAPKLRLPETVAPTSYRVQLKLDPNQDNFSGFITVEINVKQPVKTIWLNATKIHVEQAELSAAGKNLTAKAIPAGDDFLGLQFDSEIPTGAAEIRIRYSGVVRRQDTAGIFQMVDNGNQYLFTQFESTDARSAFPCFDEPSYKVPWQLTLDVPRQDVAISNTPIEKQDTQGDRTIYTFRQTKPLPSYLVAFGVGPFEFVDAGKAGKNQVPVRIVTPKGHAADAKYAAEVTATILTRLENYFGIPYPYAKCDNVSIPVTFGFGAMENAGMVTYAQDIILARPGRDTETRRREYASVAAHELAHQWVGDLVTTAWWNDIWLNEAFATWMEQKLLAEWKPEWNTRVEDVNSKLEAEADDSLVSARKIRQEIQSKDDISNAFDAITYQKGAAVIRMFESWVGPQAFRKGVQAYLRQYAFSNATAPEFLDVVSSSSGKKNLTQAFSTFLNQAGVPLVSVALDCKQSPAVLHLKQERFVPLGSKSSSDELWQVPLCVREGEGSGTRSECVLMNQPTMDWRVEVKGCPAWIEANDDAVGYYRVNYEGGLLSALPEGDVQRRLNAPERVDFMGNVAALASAGKVSDGEALGLVPMFHNDPQRYVVQSALTLALQPRLHLVPENLEPNYRRFLLKNFQARAHELGWTPKPDEPDDVRLLRPTLVFAVATHAGDQELAKQARELTEKWFTDRAAVSPTLETAVLGTSAYYGDKALMEKFIDSLGKTTDRQDRRKIVSAMTTFRDPAAIEDGMQAVVSGRVPFMDGLPLLFAGQSAAATRPLAFEFMKAHFDELASKRPRGGGFDAGALFPQVGATYCSAEEKQKLQSFFEPRVDQFTGAPRALAQILENIDVCIAGKAAEEPSVVAFLKKY